MSPNIAQILKVRINSSRRQEVLDQILTFVASSRLERKVVFTPNPEFLVAASRDEAFCRLLNESDINVPDGFGLIWLSRLLGQPIPERVSGADLVAELLSVGDKERWTVGVVGARHGEATEAERLVDQLLFHYPGLTIVNLDQTPSRQYSSVNFQLVLACHGMGKQERWIMENKEKVKAAVFMGVGGALDFLTGFTRRAPLWMRQAGLEWLWRVLQRPEHLKRVWTAVIVFPFLVLKEKLTQKT